MNVARIYLMPVPGGRGDRVVASPEAAATWLREALPRLLAAAVSVFPSEDPKTRAAAQLLAWDVLHVHERAAAAVRDQGPLEVRLAYPPGCPDYAEGTLELGRLVAARTEADAGDTRAAEGFDLLAHEVARRLEASAA